MCDKLRIVSFAGTRSVDTPVVMDAHRSNECRPADCLKAPARSHPGLARVRCGQVARGPARTIAQRREFSIPIRKAARCEAGTRLASGAKHDTRLPCLVGRNRGDICGRFVRWALCTVRQDPIGAPARRSRVRPRNYCRSRHRIDTSSRPPVQPTVETSLHDLVDRNMCDAACADALRTVDGHW